MKEDIKQALKENGGYCPCRVEKIEDNKCPCKDFREKKECICGLFTSFAKKLSENQNDLEPEIVEMVNKDFQNLI